MSKFLWKHKPVGYRLNGCAQHPVYMLNCIPLVLISGGGAFAKWLSHEGVARPMGVEPLCPVMTVRRQLIKNQETVSQQAPTLLEPRSWTAQPPKPWEISFCCLKPPRLWYSDIASWMELVVKRFFKIPELLIHRVLSMAGHFGKSWVVIFRSRAQLPASYSAI